VRRLAAALLLACAAAVACAADTADALFAATFPGVDGKAVALAAYRGKPLIVNFWSRACPPCRTELPELAALRKEFAARGLVVLGVALEPAENAKKVRDFLYAYEVDFPSLLAGGQGIDLMQALGNEKALQPFTLVVGRDGGVLSRKIGPFSRADFLSVRDRLLP